MYFQCCHRIIGFITFLLTETKGFFIGHRRIFSRCGDNLIYFNYFCAMKQSDGLSLVHVFAREESPGSAGRPAS